MPRCPPERARRPTRARRPPRRRPAAGLGIGRGHRAPPRPASLPARARRARGAGCRTAPDRAPRARLGLFPGLGLGVEQDGGDVHAGHAVDQAVVALADDREAPAGEPIGQPELPHGLRAVEALREDPRGKRAQLLLGARLGQGGVSHVVIEVELRVVDPHRTPLAVGHEAELLRNRGTRWRREADVLAELDVVRGGALEHERGGHVHVGGAVLEVQERRIESREAIARSHGLIFPDASRRTDLWAGDAEAEGRSGAPALLPPACS